MIYEGSPAKQLPGLAQVIKEKLGANNRCLYLNSPPMVAGVRSYLAAIGVNVRQEVNSGSLILSSDQGHVVNGVFDVARMLAMLADAVNDALAHDYAGLWASGDMTWELGAEKNFEKLLAYESGLEEMFVNYPALSGICQYHRDTLPDDAIGIALSEHRSVFINETLARTNPFYSHSSSRQPQRQRLNNLNERLNQLGLRAGS